jgi:putative transposase
MLVSRAYKVELDPNNIQKTMFRRHAGAARWAYNWGLDKKIEAYKTTGKSPSAIDLHKELNALKRTDKAFGGVPWMYEVSKCAAQEALRDLDKAFQNFFRRCKEGKSGPKGFPKFKSKHQGIGSFHLTGSIKVSEKHIQLPRIGSVRLKESGYLPKESENIHILSVTISEKADHWFVSLAVEEKVLELSPPTGEALGIDVGISHLATLSDGTVFDNSKALKNAEVKLRRLQKSLSHKVKGSNNRRKAKQKVAKLHYRVSNIRRDSIQKATSAVIAKHPKIIGIETLNIKGMLKNHKLAKALADVSMSEFLRVLIYKAGWAGIPIIKADRWFPSSKLCTGCGVCFKELKLSDRVFKCPVCGLVIGRDLNAAINLKVFAESSSVLPVLKGPGKACGVGSSGRVRKNSTKLPTVKQEPNASYSACGIGG